MYSIKLTKEQLAVVSEALCNLAYFRVAPIIVHIANQVNEQEAQPNISAVVEEKDKSN